MKKFWFHGLALSLGLIGSSPVLGQYPGVAGGLGASSFPVQTQPQYNYGQQPQYNVQSLPQAPQNTLPTYQYGVHSSQPSSASGYSLVSGPLPQVPANYHSIAEPQYQLVSGQQSQAELVPHQPPLQPQPQYTVPQPIQSAPSADHAYSAPAAPHTAPPSVSADYGYQQNLAPNCTSCNNAPVSGGYSYAQPVYSQPAYNYAPSFPARRGAGICSMPPCAKPWFFGGGVLLMNRIDNYSVPLSFEDSAYMPDILTTGDAEMGVMPGFEVTGGRYFNCGKNAIAATYWGVFSDDEEAIRARTVGGDYRSRIPFLYMDILDPAGGAPYGMPTRGVYDWYDNAYTHAVYRSSQYHNIEINLLGFAAGCAARNFNMPLRKHGFGHGLGGGCGSCGGAGCASCCQPCQPCAPTRMATGPCGVTAPPCGSRLSMSWLGGFRYFRFEDNLTYAASLNDPYITRATDDLYYDVNTTNDLVGFQIGGTLNFCLHCRVNLYGTAKTGIYGNHSTLYTRLATDYQTAYLNDTRTPANPNQGLAYSFNESKTDTAFLSEFGTGMGIRFSPAWWATVGYRAVIASGVATSPDNVQYGFANYAAIRDYDNYSTMVLHGLNIGLQCNY